MQQTTGKKSIKLNLFKNNVGIYTKIPVCFKVILPIFIFGINFRLFNIKSSTSKLTLKLIKVSVL